ncbi:glycosyltransferase family 2 protein [Candidatus Latescibacterota bacterium]
MYNAKKICAIIPAFNEELLIAKTIQNIPEFVDHIVVVDDCSTDGTPEIVKEIERENERVYYIRHNKNLGVGAALSSGYIWCRENDIDIAAVMNGDNQMDPKDLPNLIDPLIHNCADYTKGNRLVTGEAWNKIPRIRYLGNSLLTFMTKIVSGYWHVTDSQSGYSAMNKKALHILPFENLYKGFGVPNALLVRLNIYNLRVMDVPVNPVYGIGEKSSMKIHRVMFSIFFLLIHLFIRRMLQKYVIRDFHPLVLFYSLGILVLILDIPLVIRLIYYWITTGYITQINALSILFCTLSGLQFLLFAMLFDMEANKDLKGKDYPNTR